MNFLPCTTRLTNSLSYARPFVYVTSDLYIPESAIERDCKETCALDIFVSRPTYEGIGVNVPPVSDAILDPSFFQLTNTTGVEVL